MKEIIIDFEFTGLKFHKTSLLQFCALFVEDFEIIDKMNIFVKFEKRLDQLEQWEIDGLRFNKINTQEDLDRHNLRANDEKEVIDMFLSKVKDFGKVSLAGWNHAFADCNILLRLFDKYGIRFDDYLDYHARDVMCAMIPFQEELLKDEVGLHLSDLHIHLFGTFKKEDFHDAEVDCLATLDLQKWIYDKVKELK